jgi:Flp pilus assembly protein TadB
LAAFLILLSILFGGRRLALGFFFLTGALTFLVPSNLTMVGSPLMMMFSLLGWVWFTLQRRRQKRQAAQASDG